MKKTTKNLRSTATLVLLLLTTIMMAQHKQFTLEDLNFGGSNYRNMTPKQVYYAWWGDELVRTDREACAQINKKTLQETTLFTLDDVNKGISDKEA
ncbi:MAG: S9 family peptidase, partial [Prevotella sp.]|nr:S9 family peptidase [Prevotella sp.]